MTSITKKEAKEPLVWWLIPVSPATLEAEIRRMEIQGQSKEKVSETPTQPRSKHGGTCLSP
jgi:hypothetical protein